MRVVERAIEIAARASAAPGPGGVAIRRPIEVLTSVAYRGHAAWCAA
jgi:hypothetical protein